MKNHVYSWYHGTLTLKCLVIGPKGHDCAAWRELDPVATPREWWGNAFYMEAEARCVLNRHDLVITFTEKDKQAGQIYWRNVHFAVPEQVVEIAPTMEFIRAYDAFRLNYIQATDNIKIKSHAT